MKSKSFYNVEDKVRLAFAVVTVFAVFFSLMVSVLTLRSLMERSSEKLLESRLQTTVEGFESDTLDEVEIATQIVNSVTNRSRYYSSRSESYDVVNEVDDGFDVKDLNVAAIGVDVGALQSEKIVYSRVIQEGVVVYTSDIFEQNFIETTSTGFSKQESLTRCIYYYNYADTNDAGEEFVVQVAQYCAFNVGQQMRFVFWVTFAGVFITVMTFILSIGLARRLVKPLRDAAKDTNTFARHMYHEILTPLSISMVATENAIRKGDYKDGLIEVNAELKQISLRLKNLQRELKIGDEAVESSDVSMSINEIVSELIKSIGILDKEVVITGKGDRVVKGRDAILYKIILKHLLDNADKYREPRSHIEISIERKRITISNKISKGSSIDLEKLGERGYRGDGQNKSAGSGIGLAIALDLAESASSKLRFDLVEETFVAHLEF